MRPMAAERMAGDDSQGRIRVAPAQADGRAWHVRHHRPGAAARGARGLPVTRAGLPAGHRDPERVSLNTLAALCGILGCGPGDLVEPVASGGTDGRPGRGPGARPGGARSGRGGPRSCPARAGRREGERAGDLPGRAPGQSRRRLFPLPPGRCCGSGRCGRRLLAAGQIAAAVDAAAGNGQALRSLAAALAGRTARDVLADGAPPGVRRLAAELIARGSAVFTAPACKSCGAAGRPLTRSSRGGVCPRCRNRLLAVACAAAARSSRSPAAPAAASRSASGAAVTSAGTGGAGHAARPLRSRSGAAAGTQTCA